MQHMVLSLSTRVHGGLSVHSLSENCQFSLKNYFHVCQLNVDVALQLHCDAFFR